MPRPYIREPPRHPSTRHPACPLSRSRNLPVAGASRPSRPALRPHARKPDQGEMAEGVQGAAPEEPHPGRPRALWREPLPAEFRAPAEPAGDRCKPLLEGAPQALLRAEVVDQDDLAPRPGHARNLVERALGVGHRGDDVLRDDDVEESIGKRQLLRVHDGERLDMRQPVRGNARMRLAQHWLAIIDPDQPVCSRVIGQRNPGADPDFKNASADALGSCNRGLAAGVEHRPEHEVIERRPTRIRLGNRADVDLARHAPVTPLALSALEGEAARAPTLPRGQARSRNRAMDEAAAKHARLTLGGIVKDAGPSRRYAFLAVHEVDLDPARAPAEDRKS